MSKAPQTTKANAKSKCTQREEAREVLGQALEPMCCRATCSNQDLDVLCKPLANDALPTPMHNPVCTPASSSIALLLVERFARRAAISSKASRGRETRRTAPSLACKTADVGCACRLTGLHPDAAASADASADADAQHTHAYIHMSMRMPASTECRCVANPWVRASPQATECQ